MVAGGDQEPGGGDGDGVGDDAEGEGEWELADGGLGEDELDAGEDEQDRLSVVEVGEAVQQSGGAEAQCPVVNRSSLHGASSSGRFWLPSARMRTGSCLG